MSDLVSLARAARENLARGLAALQSPAVPPQLIAVAEPIAQAMNALHRIETTRGGARAEAAPVALNAARQALALLQQQGGVNLPAVDQALEAIAGSLNLIHQLAQPAPAAHAPGALANTVAAAAQPPPFPHAGPAPHHPQPAPSPPAYPAAPPAYPAAAPPAYPAAAPHLTAPAPLRAPAAAPPAPYQAPAAAAPVTAPVPQRAPVAPAPPAPYQPPPPAPSQAASWQAANPPPVVTPAAAGGAPIRLEAALGAHSPTNFYKGLSGNDVIDSGGIFVATYQIPEIGRQILVKVSMPGGYEFEALGVVRWTREAPLSGSDAPPGFGAQFTQISPEGRQLVYRYVRNREPLFHDDL